MKKLIFYTLTIFFCIISELYAQEFASKKITEIGELIPKKCLPEKDSIFNCSQIIEGKELVIQYNEKKEIEHLGISLFSPETKEMINEPVCSFIERLMLELLLQKNNNAVETKLQEYGITLDEKSMPIGNTYPPNIKFLLNKLQPPIQFFLLQQEETYYASWQLKSGEEITLTFPASRELIFGTNKKESDKTLSELLPHNRCDSVSKNAAFINFDETEPQLLNEDIYIKKGKSFTMQEFNTDTYLTKDSSDSFFLFFDATNPAFSLQNLLLIRDIETDVKLHIVQKMYGGFSPEFEIKPSDFICFFQADFDMYAFVDDSKQDMLEATLILFNRRFSYMHILTVKTDKNELFAQNGILYAEFYSNIPQHNLKNIFEK